MGPENTPENIMAVVERIAQKFSPERIYLFSSKRAGISKSAGFKLCVIVECADMSECERQIYLQIDSDVPYDIVLYTPATWEELLKRKGSLAQRIVESGAVVYG